ncbi:unnamed protein product (macronuclear) [Paramecium tetraurelia]|uniref:ABC transporter domain-containing protein n=1 Tax=Paramecium tetraurelia TaxID=5888 RepID=A0CKG0_PARTE|nr:uncharacterized protein GSPATT00000991001 [Paramecium tetraurelia]CAK71277.1 unnamed protein product [Paramecium tetraurelia]|eukprot:XP_001438674.1 hypothetical protein (macronuclear) [Paramecium tetraurelia strain d4-2]
MNQLKTLLEKNFTLHFRSKQFWVNLYVPILSAILSIIFTYKNNETYYILLIFVCLNNNGALRHSLILIIREKSSNFKKLQQQMGLSSNAYYASWIITFFVLTIGVSLLYIIPFIIFRLNEAGDGHLRIDMLFLGFILYSCALASFVLFLSSFSKNQNKASELIGLLNVVLTFVVISNFAPEPKLTFLGQLPTLFVPQTAFQMLLLSSNWLYKEQEYFLNPGIYITCLIVQIVAYSLGFMYFDQVLSGSKRYFFLCNYCKKNNKTYADFDDESTPNVNNQDAEPYQLYKPMLNIQDQLVENQGQPYIQVENMWKKIENQYILKSLNMEIYQNEIYCLLGPNGAGKSTLISILSGLQEKTKGKINILGQSIDNKQFKNQIGICLQKDVLYSELNVYEHLKFYGQLRGILDQELQQQINYILQVCQLLNEANTKADHLSGGNKRKLSLAISLIGNSKIVFLDEPSSGMDALTRQQIWDVIKQMRLHRVIIMTTHHMEEADELASRVGILMNGQIVTQGTPDFIKLNFGVGYHLQMDFQDQNQLLLEKPRIQAQLQKIDSYTPVIQSAPNSLKSVLPVNKIHLFHELLNYLEENSQSKFSLQLNSLEDSYLAIDYQYGTQNIDLNAQRVFQQKPKIDFKAQLFSLAQRKLLLLLSSTDKQWKYLFPLPFIYIAVIFGLQSSFLFVFLYLTIKALTSTLYVMIQLDDKDTKIKQYMYASGVQIHTYWLSNVLTDIVPSIIEGLFTAVLLYIYDVGHFGQHIFGVFLLITVFGVSLSCFANCIAVFQGNSQRVYVGAPLLQFFVFFLLFFIFMLYTAQPSCSLGLNMFSMLLMVLSPYSACYMGFAMSPILLNGAIFSYFSCILYLILGGIVYYLILQQLDKGQFKQIQPDMSDTDAVIDVQELTKKVGVVETVHKLSFQVKQKEIYGLLGPNGAGKSTTFNMISKFDQPTTGQVRVRDAESNLGLVPQFCPFYPTLTVYQHLSIYGALKGQENLQNAIEVYLKALDMYDIKDRKVEYLSGGERRKVQIGIALIGGSNRLFMDEPTTGLDPKSRRIIQQILLQSTINNDASVLLTTHSLQEAQSICNRIGIMVNGFLITQGTINELRAQLGEQARFSVKCNIGRKEQVHQTIWLQLSQQFQLQPVFEYRENYLSYQIPAGYFKLSNLFQYLQVELKQKQLLITDFSIYQPSLDQIFAFFASQQIVGLNQNLLNNMGDNQFDFGNRLRAIMAFFCIFW